MDNFKKWLHLALLIPKDIINTKCPSCSTKDLNYQYVCDDDTKIGYLDIWCNSCQKGVHFSRVKVPEEIDYISFKLIENVKSKIPNFKQVTPK